MTISLYLKFNTFNREFVLRNVLFKNEFLLIVVSYFTTVATGVDTQNSPIKTGTDIVNIHVRQQLRHHLEKVEICMFYFFVFIANQN